MNVCILIYKLYHEAKENRIYPEVTKHLSCSTKLGMQFQLLIKYHALKFSDVAFISFINDKIQTILTCYHL